MSNARLTPNADEWRIACSTIDRLRLANRELLEAATEAVDEIESSHNLSAYTYARLKRVVAKAKRLVEEEPQ